MKVNKCVEASLDILDRIEGVPMLRIAQIRSYIKKLEKEKEELDWFFSRVSKLVRERTYGEDE